VSRGYTGRLNMLDGACLLAYLLSLCGGGVCMCALLLLLCVRCCVRQGRQVCADERLLEHGRGYLHHVDATERQLCLLVEANGAEQRHQQSTFVERVWTLAARHQRRKHQQQVQHTCQRID